MGNVDCWAGPGSSGLIQPSLTCAGRFWLGFSFGIGWWVGGVVGWLLAQVGEVIDQIIPSDEKSPTILHNVSS